MTNDTEFGRLLRGTFVALALCAAFVAGAYWWIDRPTAFWVHNHGIAQHVVLKWITLVPPVLQTWSPLLLALALLRRAFGPWSKFERVVFAAALAIIVADQFRESLSAVFGRYWPETWHNDNPSLISNQAYGFHWFRTGDDDGSFPSGHMARTVAAGGVAWIAYHHAALRSVVVVAGVAMAVGLIGMNYHFVSDVIAGSFVGGIVAAYAATLCPCAGPSMLHRASDPRSA